MLPDEITIGAKYDPAMKITDQAEADRYFEECVEHCMRFAHSREEVERIERSNLGYYAGYYSDETRRQVERLFRCEHPVFGSIAEKGAPTAEQAYGPHNGCLPERGNNDDAPHKRQPTRSAVTSRRLIKMRGWRGNKAGRAMCALRCGMGRTMRRQARPVGSSRNQLKSEINNADHP